MQLPPPPPGFMLEKSEQSPFGGRPIIRERAPQPTPRHADDARKGQIDAGVAEATRGDQIRKARADALKAEADARNAQRGNPADAEARRNAKSQRQDLGMIAQQLNRVQQLYRQDLKGSGLSSLGEYLPTPKMQRFEAQSKALAVLMKPLIRNPGEGTWTDKDQAILDRLVPTRYTADEDNEERIETAKRFVLGKLKNAGGGGRRVPARDQQSPSVIDFNDLPE